MTDYQIYTNMFAGFTNLFYMAPETSQIEPEKVRQTFISNLVVDSATRPTVNMSIWNGPIHAWNADYITIDENMNIHGPAVLNLPTDHFNDTGRHKFLNWSLKSISGTFNHGVINGIVCLITWQGQTIWATFKDGILHGPAFQYGVVPILMDVSKLLCIVITISEQMLFSLDWLLTKNQILNTGRSNENNKISIKNICSSKVKGILNLFDIPYSHE